MLERQLNFDLLGEAAPHRALLLPSLSALRELHLIDVRQGVSLNGCADADGVWEEAARIQDGCANAGGVWEKVKELEDVREKRS